VVRVEIGPKTLLLKDEEVAVFGPSPMIIIPPRMYCIIENPVCVRLDEHKRSVVVFDEHGLAKLRHGDTEVRLEQEPFPLYPGEVMKGKVEFLELVSPSEALKLEATHDFVDRYALDKEGNAITRKAGEKWLFYGPATYVPQPEVRVIQTVKPEVLKSNQAIKLEAINSFIDRDGRKREAGEQWIFNTEGSFLPDINEKIVEKVSGIILTDKKAIYVEALTNFTDSRGNDRRAGDVWIVTKDDCEVYISDVGSKITNNNVEITTLNNRQYCIIQNPLENGKPQYGKRKLIKEEGSFFLNPFEVLEGKMECYVLTAEKALSVRANTTFIGMVSKIWNYLQFRWRN
jgi:major vault protein